MNNILLFGPYRVLDPFLSFCNDAVSFLEKGLSLKMESVSSKAIPHFIRTTHVETCLLACFVHAISMGLDVGKKRRTEFCE